jgi:hypothetical protein
MATSRSLVSWLTRPQSIEMARKNIDRHVNDRSRFASRVIRNRHLIQSVAAITTLRLVAQHLVHVDATGPCH